VSRVGTLEWAKRTGGRLSNLDRFRQLMAAVQLQMHVLPDQLRWRLGLSAPGALVDITAIPIPDSAAARRAEEYCRDVAPPYLVNHSLRTYLWASALAAPCGLRPDPELLWTASLLHDLGLCEAHRDNAPEIECFAVRGADAARALLVDCGWEPVRADALYEAITLHINVAVDDEDGPESLLLNAATALDVTGLRIWELHRDTVRAVVDRHPRLGMKSAIASAWKLEASTHRRSRAYFLSKWLQFETRILNAPFAD